jgi:hypothetical protein
LYLYFPDISRNNPEEENTKYFSFLLIIIWWLSYHNKNKLSSHIVTWQLNAGIVERIDAAIARQRRSKRVSVASDAAATIDDVVFSMLFMPRLYNEDQLELSWFGSRKRLTIKYVHDSRGTQNKESLCWRGPVAIYQSVSQTDRETYRKTDTSPRLRCPGQNKYLGPWSRWDLKPRRTVLARTSSNLPDWPTYWQARESTISRRSESVVSSLESHYWQQLLGNV